MPSPAGQCIASEWCVMQVSQGASKMVQYGAHCYYHSVAQPTNLVPTSTVNVVGAVSALDVATAQQIAAVQAVVVAAVEAWQGQLELHSTGLLMQHQASK